MCVEAFSSPLLVSFAIVECKHDSCQLVICTSRWPTSDLFHTFIVVSVNGLRQDCTCCVADYVAALYPKTRELCCFLPEEGVAFECNLCSHC